MRLRGALSAAMMLAGLVPAVAESDWQPFKENDGPRPRRAAATAATDAPALPPMGGVIPTPGTPRGPSLQGTDPQPSGFGSAYPGSASPPPFAAPLSGSSPPQAAAIGKVERLEVEPTLAADGSGLPQDAWRSMDIKALEEALAGAALPPRSAALAGLWSRLLLAEIDPPQGGRSPEHFKALRLEALYRAGRLDDMGKRLAATPEADPIFQAYRIRHALAVGNQATACQTSKGLMARRAELPKSLVSELHLLAGYCAAAEGNAAGAGIAAELAREAGVDAPVAMAALDALAGNGKAGLAVPKLVRVLDYRLLELLAPIDPAQILDKAEPPLLAALALDDKVDPGMRTAAAEAAARLNIITTEQLSAIYTAAPAGADVPALRRGELVRLIAAEAQQARKLQLAKSALEDARKAGVAQPMARVLALTLKDVRPAAGLEPYGETAAEIFLAGADLPKARAFASTPEARHWLALIDSADSAPTEGQRAQNLVALDDMVRRNRFPAPLLHRLATVLDATDVNVPIPLWEAASRTPQPATGALPDTGVLPQLQDAAKKKDIARTVLLALRATGTAEADGLHIIALGDTIRALRRASLDRDARQLGVEALIAQWPRGTAP